MKAEHSIQLEDPRKAHYVAELERISPNGDPRWLNQLRRDGLALFRETDYPHTRMEEWRQTNITPILDTEYRSVLEAPKHGLTRDHAAPFFYGSGQWTELVFVDGHFDESLSVRAALPEGVWAGGLREALHGPESASVEAHLGKYLKKRNAFTALNTAFLVDGAFVHVPKNVVVEQPIHLVFITSRHEAPTVAHPRTLMVLDPGSEARVVTSFVGLDGGANYLNNVVEEIVLGENSSLCLCKNVQESAEGRHLATTEIHHARDSRQKTFVATLSGDIVRNQVCTELNGEGAECKLGVLYLNGGKRLADHMLSIVHAKPHCISRITCKGILDDESRAVFLGRVYVHPEAQQTDSKQLNKNLLLSDRASVETKPQLEIYADDVKCTHGATVGAPPPEVLFYFRSRGIPEAAARGMLTCGFANEVLEEAPVEAVRERLNRYVFEKYAPAKIR